MKITKKIDQKFTLNKTKHVLAKNVLNELSKKIELTQEKELTKYLINGCSIFKGGNILLKTDHKIILLLW